MNVNIKDEGGMKTVWEEEAPGSVHPNRCLVEAICDENQTAAMVVCVAPVEAEREMSKSILRIEIGDKWKNFTLRLLIQWRMRGEHEPMVGYRVLGHHTCVTYAMQHRKLQSLILELLVSLENLRRLRR